MTAPFYFAPRSGRSNMFPATTWGISGVVVDGSANPIANCVIQLLASGVVIATSTTNGAGQYTFNGLTPGAYVVTNHPALAYSIADAGSFAVNVGGSSATQNFIVQAALYSDNFQQYTATSNFVAGVDTAANPATPGNFWYHGGDAAYQMAACAAQTGEITYDPTGGPGGTKAMKYAFPARPGSATSYTIQLGPRVNPPPVVSEIWVRWKEMYSAGFQDGGAGVHGAGRSYKVLLVQTGNPLDEIGVYFAGDTTQGQNIFFQNNIGNSIYVLGDPGTPASWMGAFHAMVLGITNLGTSLSTATLYMDGVPLLTNTGLVGGGNPVGGAGQLIFLNMGANINNGPDLAQQRWWAELGLYTTRPSLLF